jgi:hypothetical protein
MSISQVIIPEWENSYLKAKATSAKYYNANEYSKLPLKHKNNNPMLLQKGSKQVWGNTNEGPFVKNSVSAGKPNLWVLNGQDLYNASLNWRLRKNVAKYYHEYFKRYIKNQLEPISLGEDEFLSISCDIYEIKRGQMPDVSNMWLLEKFFEDALQEAGIIPDDSPDYVIESGRKRYYWVKNPGERKLVFNIKIIKT